METGKRKLQSNPRKTANIFSIIFFGWTIPFFKRSYKRNLEPTDVSEPLVSDQSSNLGDRLERAWHNECKKSGEPSLKRAIVKAFWLEITILGIFCFINDVVVRLTLPFLLEGLLSYFRENSHVTQNDALKYGTGIFIINTFFGISQLHYSYCGFHFGARVRIAVTSLIYRKSLQLSQSSLSDTAPGKLANLLSNDVSRFDINGILLHTLWTCPLMAIIATYILWIESRWSVFGLVIVVLVAPLQSYVGKLSAAIRFKTALRTDERVRFMDEIISGVQVIKMYAWEMPFARLIATARRLEMKEIVKNGYVRGLFMTFNLFTNRMALFCAVLATVLIEGSGGIQVSKMFMISYIFTAISQALCTQFVRGIAEVSATFVSIDRLQMFLEYEEKSESTNNSSEKTNSDQFSISIENATVGWTDISSQKQALKTKKKVGSYKSAAKQIDIEVNPFKLQQINLQIPKGKLCFVIGPVGAGKSSLLQVLLKELPLEIGSMEINGSISYACQESWIFTSNVRQNITFGQPMNRLRYDEVVQCTALKADFAQLSAGDMTVVGENGTGLSGGQKARVNLARAVYRNADIYLIDDPLSAVDTHVQSHLFNSCLGPNGFLARQNATRILVTHQIHFLKEADWIVVLKNGEIEIQGDYNEILNSGIDITSILNRNEENEETNPEDDGMKEKTESSSNSLQNIEKSVDETSSDKNNEKESVANEENALLKELEASSRGTVKGSLLLNYLRSARRPFTLAFIIVTLLLAQLLASSADIWVSYWIRLEETRQSELNTTITESSTNHSNGTTIELTTNTWSTSTYACIYVGIMASLFIIASSRSMVVFNFCCTASQNLHDSMFRGLVSTTMRFFETNASGRIINRFSKDMGSIDEALPKALFDALQINFYVIACIMVTIFTNYKFSFLVLIMGVLFLWIRKNYLESSTNIKRFEGTTKSPVFSHISATLSGLSTIRAFQAEALLRQEFEDHQDLNTGAWLMIISTSCAFGMSLDLMVYIFIACVIYSFILMSGGATGDIVGLALTQSLTLTSILQLGVVQSAEVTNNLMSVERILEYTQLDPEKQPEIPEKPPKDWPTQGKIEFKNVFYRYSIDHEPVLRGLSFSVKSREKVSVVGRTGAGKSSLINSIFRMAIVEGDIVIDGVDTSCINLNELRSKISIIPQEPTLFSGTLRRNLDPFEEYTDDVLWFALESVGLKDLVSENNGLQMPVLARGQNFSTGQRQILCLARAILRKNRIIILDEATANVDLKTDEMIQRTIREKFCDSTVITIAHRLYTVIDSDRILVMDAGVAVEFDDPYSLMQNKDSIFRKMVEALGPQEYDRLYSLAKDKHDELKNE